MAWRRKTHLIEFPMTKRYSKRGLLESPEQTLMRFWAYILQGGAIYISGGYEDYV